jgi:hypothetical protein
MKIQELRKKAEIRKIPEGRKHSEKVVKSGIFPGNPEDLATLVTNAFL